MSERNGPRGAHPGTPGDRLQCLRPGSATGSSSVSTLRRSGEGEGGVDARADGATHEPRAPVAVGPAGAPERAGATVPGAATGPERPATAGSTTGAASAAPSNEQAALALIHNRQHVAPKRLEAPGPDAGQLEGLLRAAAAAPDHGRIAPWRFVLVPPDRRALLAEAFVAALRERDPEADAQAVAAAGEKAFRAPVLLLAVARLGHAEPDTPAAERLVSLGCAIQNLLLAAEAAGYGSGLTSGQAMDSPALRGLFRLAPDEQAVCFVNLGTVRSRRPPRPRPEPRDFLSSL